MDPTLIQAQPNFLFGGNGNTLSIPSRNGDGGLPAGLIDAIIGQESSGKANARGKKGERGLMQIMPTTAAMFGVTPEQLADPTINRHVGTQYLQSLIKRYNGNIPTALAAYNAGPHNVDKGSVPKSTEAYVTKIMNSLGGGIVGTAQAEDLPAQLRGATEATNPWQQNLAGHEVSNPWGAGAAPSAKSGAEGWYEKNVANPATSGLASALSKLNPQGLSMSSAMAGTSSPQAALGAKPLTGSDSQSLAKDIVPQDLTSAAIDAGLLSTGLGEMGLLTRLGIPAISGAIGAYAQGGSPMSGAGRGALSAAGGEVIGGVTGIGARALGKNKLLQDTTEKVGKSLADTLGQKIGFRAPESAAALERVFKFGGAAKRAGDIAQNVSQRAERSMAGKLIRVDPALSTTPVTLSEAENLIDSLNEGSYLPSGAARGVQGRGAMLRQAYALREQIARRLNTVSPGMGTLWRQSRRDLGAAKTLQALFQEPGVLEGKVINQPKLEQLITSKKYWSRLQNTLGTDETNQFLKTIRRGGVGPSADIPGKAPHIGMGIGGHLHSNLPHTYKPAGQIPSLMRPAATNPMRIPGGVGTSGALGFWDAPIDNQGSSQ